MLIKIYLGCCVLKVMPSNNKVIKGDMVAGYMCCLL